MTRNPVKARRTCGIYVFVFIVALLVVAAITLFVVVGPELEHRRQAAIRAEQIETQYQAGITYQDLEDWASAEAALKSVISEDPSYKDVQTRLKEVRHQLEAIQITATAEALDTIAQKQVSIQATATAESRATIEAQAKRTVTAEAAPTATQVALAAEYEKALGYMNIEHWLEAREALVRVFEVAPNFGEVQTKLVEVEAEVAKLTPTATATPQVTSTPTPTTTPPEVTLRPSSAISFQNEGTTDTDDTTLISQKDGFWAPSLTGTVHQDYYATGTGVMYFDAVTLEFDIGERTYQDFHAILRPFVQLGDYASHGGDSSWQHYLALPGKHNTEYQDAIPSAVPQTGSIDYSTGKWIEIELTPKFWSEGTIWVTLRLWNVRVDAVELVLTPK